MRAEPVIAIGVVGPPEPCIVAGYDKGGEVLIGWSFFQDRPEDRPRPGIRAVGLLSQA